MKFYLLLVTFLTGCCPTAVAPPSPAETPSLPAYPMVADGSNGPIDWHCEVQEVNDKLVWVECQFQNVVHFPVGSVCVNTNFYDKESLKLVIGSRNVCSGPLETLGKTINYSAYIKENRVTLRQCGDRLQYCMMLAERNLEVIR